MPGGVAPRRAPLALALLALGAGCALPRGAERPPLPVLLHAAHPEPEVVGERHRVATGETLFRIARTYGLSPEELAAANGIRDPRSLEVGQELWVPGAPEAALPAAGGELDGGTLAPEPLAPLAPAPVRPMPAPPPGRAAPRVATPAPPATRGTLQWPLKGVLYGRFGKKGREPHDGIDLAAPEGTPVRTARAGRVLYAGEQRGYGLIVIVEHSERLVTLYAHNRDLRVRTGQQVRDGQVIATVGQSGKTSGPHLHFEVRLDGRPVDPLAFLAARPSS